MTLTLSASERHKLDKLKRAQKALLAAHRKEQARARKAARQKRAKAMKAAPQEQRQERLRDNAYLAATRRLPCVARARAGRLRRSG